jgi:site-specific recombinase XerD
MGAFESRDPDRRSLPFAEWPNGDRTAWTTALADGGILDDSGPGANWSSKTRDKYLGGYARWLGFLQRQGWLDADEAPADRVTRERMRAYVGKLKEQRVADYTLIGRLLELRAVMTAFAPERDWSWLTKPAEAMRRRGLTVRPELDLPPSDMLFKTGFDMMAEVPTLTGPMRRAVLFRNGLMVALLGARPIRLKNLAQMELGRHILDLEGAARLVFEAEEVKNGDALEWPLPSELVDAIKIYLEVYRPVLLKGGSMSAFWVNQNGTRLDEKGIARQIRLITEKRFGVVFGPHRFRHAMATTIAVEDPSHVGIVPNLLGHRSHRTAERHYIRARMVEAVTKGQASFLALRRELAPPGRRKHDDVSESLEP